MSAIDPLACERCGRRLESDDAISVIEGVCGVCRNTAQSLVQPRRADELLTRLHQVDETDDFLADLPKIEPWRPSPIPSEPWLVEDSQRENSAYASSVADYFDADGHANDDATDEPQDDARVAADTVEDDSEESTPQTSMIPPGPFSAARRPKPAVKDPIESISEIFSEDGIPPSELSPADQRESSASGKIDIHNFTPPNVSFPQEAPKRRRRKKAVAVGVFIGVLLTAVGAWLATDHRMRERAIAWVNELRHPDAIIAGPETVELTILIDPPNADIRLNGTKLEPSDDMGRVHLVLDPETMTDKLLEVSAPGYHSVTQALSDFRGVDEAVLRLTQRPFQAEIGTDPDGAEVFLEGQLVGTSPVKITVDPEVASEIVVRMEGYKNLTRVLSSPDNSDTLVLRLPLEPAGVNLAVDTDPVPAQIWVNDRLFGRTPLEIELNYEFLGRDVEIVARADGFDDARMTIPMPKVGGDEMDASIKLERTMSRLNVRTEPPGGRVILAGRDYGNAPVMVEFEPTETGKQIVIDTSLDGQYFGRQAVSIPAAGGPRECVIPMAFSAQRVVFVIAASRRAQADQYLLADALASRIEQLEPTQRFAILAATDDGVEAWPFEVAFESATSEQKVRAFDMVRSIRSADQVDIESLFDSAVQLDPTTVWIFAETANRPALEKLSEQLAGRDVSINLISASLVQNDIWFDGFAARHHGVFKTLDETVAITDELGE